MPINILRVDVKRVRPDSSVVPSNRTRGNRHKLKHRKFHLITRKNFLTLRVTEHWIRLPRGVVESSSLEILKTHLDMVLCFVFSLRSVVCVCVQLSFIQKLTTSQKTCSIYSFGLCMYAAMFTNNM